VALPDSYTLKPNAIPAYFDVEDGVLPRHQEVKPDRLPVLVDILETSR